MGTLVTRIYTLSSRSHIVITPKLDFKRGATSLLKRANDDKRAICNNTAIQFVVVGDLQLYFRINSFMFTFFTLIQGGESIYGKAFKDEFHQRIRFTHRGIVAMANENKSHSNHSQFFITFDKTEWLHVSKPGG